MSQWLVQSQLFARRGAIAGASALLFICAFDIIYQWDTYSGPEGMTFWAVFVYFLYVLPVSALAAVSSVVVCHAILLVRRGRNISPNVGAAFWGGSAFVGTVVALCLGVNTLAAIIVGSAILAGGLIAILGRYKSKQSLLDDVQPARSDRG